MLFCCYRYKKWNLSHNFTLPVLSQINTIASSLKSKYLISKVASTISNGFLLLPASYDGSGLAFFVHRAWADSLPTEY